MPNLFRSRSLVPAGLNPRRGGARTVVLAGIAGAAAAVGAAALLTNIFERQQAAKQPGACLHCHASMYVAYRRAGNGDLIKGFEALNPLPYAEAKRRAGATHPVACIDCHEPATMQLRVTRPGFLEGIRALKASQGVADYDVNRDATRQEMRTYVCGQCHVEYYFKGAEKRLTYPWDRGIVVDSMFAHYEANGHKDWTHARSGAPVLKAQHPEFELYNQGVHARSGVSCADCHMPYKRTGALKISDHHVRSPLLNLDRSCQACHKISEGELRERVYVIQERTFQLRNIAIDALLELVAGIEAARRADSTSPRVAPAQRYQRAAQFYTDFIEAENSMGFHADQEHAGHCRSPANSCGAARPGSGAGPCPGTTEGVSSRSGSPVANSFRSPVICGAFRSSDVVLFTRVALRALQSSHIEPEGTDKLWGSAAIAHGAITLLLTPDPVLDQARQRSVSLATKPSEGLLRHFIRLAEVAK